MYANQLHKSLCDSFNAALKPRGPSEQSHVIRYRETWKHVAEHLSHNHPASVLEVGLHGCFTYAVREALDKFLPSVTWYTTDDLELSELFNRADDYNLIVCMEVIEHIRDPHECKRDEFTSTGQMNLMRSLRDCIANDGTLILTTPNSAGWCALRRLLKGEPPRMYDQHVRELSPLEFDHLAKLCGWRVEKMTGLDVWPHLPGNDDSWRERMKRSPGFVAGIPREDCILYVCKKA